jgi:hypothetical protein
MGPARNSKADRRRAGIGVAIGLMAGIWTAGAVAAPTLFFGQDPAVADEPDPFAAEQEFLGAVAQRGWQVGSQGFEGLATGSPAQGLSAGLTPLQDPLTVTVSEQPVSALSQVRDGSQAREGRYPVFDVLAEPTSVSDRWLDLGSSATTLTFSRPLAALGFFAVDIGEPEPGGTGNPGGQLTLDLGGGQSLSIPHRQGENGLLLFYGVIFDQPVAQVTLQNSQGGVDLFGIDNLRVAPIPLPPALTLLASALVALLPRRRRSA